MNILGLFRNKFVLIAATALVLLAFVGGGLASFRAGAVAVDPETELSASGIVGHVKLQGGTDHGDSFITSGDPGYASQSITAVSTIRGDGSLAGWALCKVKYTVFVNDVEQAPLASPAWDFAQLGAFRDTAPHDVHSHTFNLITGAPPLNGKVRVDLYGYVGTGTHRVTGPCDSWVRLAYDGAQLKDGSGTVKLTPGQSDIFEEAQTVNLDVRSGEGAWTLQMFDGTGAPCKCATGGWTSSLQLVNLPNGCQYDLTRSMVVNCPSSAGQSSISWNGPRSATAQFTVPDGAFSTIGSNTWRVVLKNTLIDQSSEQFITIDKKVLAPEPPRVVPSATKPSVGDSVTLTMTSRANPNSSAVDHFEVYVWYGTEDVLPVQASPNWLARGIVVHATAAGAAGYTGQYSFTITEPQVVRWRIYAVDASGRTSASSLNNEDRGALEGVGIPDANGDSRGHVDPPGSENHPVGILTPRDHADSTLILLALIGLAVASVLVWRLVPAPPVARAGIIVLALGGALYVILPALGVVG